MGDEHFNDILDRKYSRESWFIKLLQSSTWKNNASYVESITAEGLESITLIAAPFRVFAKGRQTIWKNFAFRKVI